MTATEPSSSVRVAGWTVFTSTRLQQVTAPNMKDRPKDLGLVLPCKSFFKLCNCLHPVQQQKLGERHQSLVKQSVWRLICESSGNI